MPAVVKKADGELSIKQLSKPIIQQAKDVAEHMYIVDAPYEENTRRTAPTLRGQIKHRTPKHIVLC